MKQYTESELASILNLHKAWIIGEDYGKRADLREADLREADLRWADLRWADLSGADLDYSVLPLMSVLYVMAWIRIAVVIMKLISLQNRTIVHSVVQKWMEVLNDGC